MKKNGRRWREIERDTTREREREPHGERSTLLMLF